MPCITRLGWQRLMHPASCGPRLSLARRLGLAGVVSRLCGLVPGDDNGTFGEMPGWFLAAQMARYLHTAHFPVSGTDLVHGAP